MTLEGEQGPSTFVDQVVCSDNVAVLSSLPAESVDLFVTSPPYDNLRKYGGQPWDFKALAGEMTRTLKVGGVIVWNVSDSVVNGSESLTSMRQAIHFHDVLGLRVHDTQIYLKNSYVPKNHNRYEQAWEYLFVFTKGKPKTFNPILVPCVTAGSRRWRGAEKQNEATYSMKRVNKHTTVKTHKIHPNVFAYDVGKNAKTTHNAPFPIELARDAVISWSNVGDFVVDPFVGSGTTVVAAKQLNRHFLGIDIHKPYCAETLRRLTETITPYPDEAQSES